MELKYIHKLLAAIDDKSSNRTFMELKLSNHCLLTVRVRSSNRTFMELKLPKNPMEQIDTEEF